MTWATRFRFRQVLTGSLWVTPLLGGVLGGVLSYGTIAIDKRVTMPPGWTYSASTALSVLTTVIVAALSLTGFVVTVTVLAVQIATGTYSARYMRLWYRDRLLKATLAVLVATFTFSYTLLRRVDTVVPSLGVSLAGLFLMAGVIMFLAFLDRAVHRLRAVKVASVVARAGTRTLQSVARTHLSGMEHDPALLDLLETEPVLVVRAQRSGSIQAIDTKGLVSAAARNDCVIVLIHSVGDFVTKGARVAEVYGGPLQAPNMTDHRVSGMFAVGVERTIEQDPAFALRILVDVAIRALSAAVNDPTTAVQVMDYLEDTLVTIGNLPGLEGRLVAADAGGQPRIVVPVRSWEDFLALGVTEIRLYGANAVQVMRRLRALLVALEEAVLPEYRPAVAAELARLDVTVAGGLGTTGDRDLAERADRQGIGGPGSRG